MRLSRVWSMPNKWTFKIKPISKLLERYNVGKNWADPFCGQSTICQYRNDLDPNNKCAQWHCEAEKFMDSDLRNLSGVVFDPPYSLTQVSRSYKEIGLKFHGKENPTGGFPKVKDAIAKRVRKGGYVISFGWNSIGMGKRRGFEIVEILLVCHGGNRNDTIVTVEVKK